MANLTLKELKSLAANQEIDTVIMLFTDHYGRSMGKRADVDFFIKSAAQDGVGACNYLLTVDMDMNPVAGFDYANWSKGYGDFRLQPDMATLRVAAWLDKTALVICQVLDEQTGQPVSIAPRSLLVKQVARLAELGFTAKAGSELEHYLFNTSYQQAHTQHYNNLEPAGWYLEDYHLLQGERQEKLNAPVRRYLRDSGVPVETSKGEWGMGQHEINLCYADVLEMADRHVIFKQCAKETADKLGLSLTFMAKPFAEQAGSSCHMHVSLWHGKKNAFAGTHALTEQVNVSKEFGWFLAGWMRYAPELMVMFAPTINSYKRYQNASWAPTRLAWSIDNRTAGFRIVGHGDSLRIESRIAGADVNPYLAYSAILAAGIAGIEGQLEPQPLFNGDVYAAEDIDTLPVSLLDAVHHFEQSAAAKRFFGKEVVEHYVHHFRQEVNAYASAVTDWEKERYFEQI